MNSDKMKQTDSADGNRIKEDVSDEFPPEPKTMEHQLSEMSKFDQTSKIDSSEREKMLTRRAVLIKAGWSVPVILAVGLPSDDVYGQSGSPNPGQSSNFHSDNSLGHEDSHDPISGGHETGPGGLHGDAAAGTGHEDASTGRHDDSTDPFNPFRVRRPR